MTGKWMDVSEGFDKDVEIASLKAQIESLTYMLQVERETQAGAIEGAVATAIQEHLPTKFYLVSEIGRSGVHISPMRVFTKEEDAWKLYDKNRKRQYSTGRIWELSSTEDSINITNKREKEKNRVAKEKEKAAVRAAKYKETKAKLAKLKTPQVAQPWNIGLPK